MSGDRESLRPVAGANRALRKALKLKDELLFRAGDERSLVLFAMAVGMISVLVVLEQVMLWLLSRRVRRLSQRSGAEERRDDGRAPE